MKGSKLVKIQRGAYSPQFQVARAMLSAASAVIPTNKIQATKYLNDAIAELNRIKAELVAQ